MAHRCPAVHTPWFHYLLPYEWRCRGALGWAWAEGGGSQWWQWRGCVGQDAPCKPWDWWCGHRLPLSVFVSLCFPELPTSQSRWWWRWWRGQLWPHGIAVCAAFFGAGPCAHRGCSCARHSSGCPYPCRCISPRSRLPPSPNPSPGPCPCPCLCSYPCPSPRSCPCPCSSTCCTREVVVGNPGSAGAVAGRRVMGELKGSALVIF